MRRFIKSRPYVPVHELRRRFLIEGIEDEVNPMTAGDGTLYVGLPEREAGFLGELVKAGEVGCELLPRPDESRRGGRLPDEAGGAPVVGDANRQRLSPGRGSRPGRSLPLGSGK